jgi:hypothetical protein
MINFSHKDGFRFMMPLFIEPCFQILSISAPSLSRLTSMYFSYLAFTLCPLIFYFSAVKDFCLYAAEMFWEPSYKSWANLLSSMEDPCFLFSLFCCIYLMWKT